MAISVVADDSGALTASANPSVTFTGWTPVKDDVVYLYASSTGIAALNAAPASWENVLGGTTLVVSDSHSAAGVVHVVTATEATAGTVTYSCTGLFTTAQTGNVCGIVLRGVDTAAIIDSANSTFNSGNTITPHVLASLTGANLSNNSVVVSAVTKDATGTYTTPTGYTVRTTSNTNQGTWLGTRNSLTTTGTNVAATNITPSAGDEYVSISVAFTEKPPPLPPSGLVAEPPWINQNEGVSARNGTTTHVIGHSTAATSPSSGGVLDFVPTVGSLLGCVVIGGVTNTSNGTGAGSGWVEQESPVSSAEMSLFVKDEAVGNDFLSLTHNGSNYPIAWIFFEFPEGSLYTDSVSETANDVTFPALTGLPGTEQVIIAAIGAGIGSSGNTGSSTWDSGWVEDFDSYTTQSGTDGVYFTAAHQINVTATSITPTGTYDPGASSAPDRQKIVAAFAVAPIPSGITQTGTTLRFAPAMTNSGTVSSTITVPSDAEFVLVGICTWINAINAISTGTCTFTKGGSQVAMTSAVTGANGADDVTTTQMSGLFYMALPDTGPNGTLTWDFAGTTTPGEDIIVSVTFWKGVDTASPVRDCKGAQPGTTGSTPTLTAQAGDLIVLWVGAYAPTAEGSVDTWSNAVELAELARAGVTDGAWGTASPTGDQTVGVTAVTNMADIGMIGIVLKPAAGGAPAVNSGFFAMM